MRPPDFRADELAEEILSGKYAAYQNYRCPAGPWEDNISGFAEWQLYACQVYGMNPYLAGYWNSTTPCKRSRIGTREATFMGPRGSLSNTILLGALKAIRELRLRIPDDISVLSFDNYEYLDYLDPSVTRISQPSAEIGAQAMEILLRRINGDAPQAVQLRLAPSLVACRSVKRL